MLETTIIVNDEVRDWCALCTITLVNLGGSPVAFSKMQGLHSFGTAPHVELAFDMTTIAGLSDNHVEQLEQTGTRYAAVTIINQVLGIILGRAHTLRQVSVSPGGNCRLWPPATCDSNLPAH